MLSFQNSSLYRLDIEGSADSRGSQHAVLNRGLSLNNVLNNKTKLNHRLSR